jgi:hypothetical protein
MFGFQKQVTLISFTPNNNKSAVLLSTMHNDNSFDTETKKQQIGYFRSILWQLFCVYENS